MTEELVYEDDLARGELAIRADAPVTLFGTDDPAEVLERATKVADALAGVIEKQKLYAKISGKKHVLVEGWILLGSMLGVFPETVWTKRTEDSKGQEAYEARVVARTRDGSVVGAREAMCSRSEARWKNADDYAVRSMAQTRATSAALAAPLRFIVVLAGFAGTPEAEMPKGERRSDSSEPKPPRTGAEVKERLSELLGQDEAVVWVEQAFEYSQGKTLSPTGLQRLIGVVADLEADGSDFRDFPLPDARDTIQGIFAARFDGAVFPGPPWAMCGAEAEAGSPSKEDVLATAQDDGR